PGTIWRIYCRIYIQGGSHSMFFLILFASSFLQADIAQDQPLDKEKLRRALRIPPASAQVTVAAVKKNEKELQQEIDEIIKKMKNDASDAEGYYDLALRYSEKNQPDQEKKAVKKAAALFRERLKKDSTNGLLCAKLGDALMWAEERAE